MKLDKKKLKDIALRLLNETTYEHRADVWVDALEWYMKAEGLQLVKASAEVTGRLAIPDQQD